MSYKTDSIPRVRCHDRSWETDHREGEDTGPQDGFCVYLQFRILLVLVASVLYAPRRPISKKTAQLEFFKQVISEEDEPKWWPSTDGDVPQSMQHVNEPREDYWRMTLESLPEWAGRCEGFRTRSLSSCVAVV